MAFSFMINRAARRRGQVDVDLMKTSSAVLIGFLLLWSVDDGYSQERIRVGQGSVSLQSGLMHIAKDRELFAKYGLVSEIVYIPGGTTNIQMWSRVISICRS